MIRYTKEEIKLGLQVIRTILLGIIPDSIFITFFILIIKQIKEKRIMLFILISLSYVICMVIKRYNIVYYTLFIVLIYFSIYLLYRDKSNITDTFLIGFLLLCMFVTSVIAYSFMGDNLENYYICLLLNKILLIIPFIFMKKIRTIYNKYNEYWNRNDNEKRPIKSISVRNISLILLNVLMFFIYLATLSIIYKFN